MDKYEALCKIDKTWNDDSLSLKDKIYLISDEYYSEGLDLASTAAFISATPTELDSLLSLSDLDECLINRISQINPPKTTWTFFAQAGDDEINKALEGLESERAVPDRRKQTASELVYSKMLEVAEPTVQQKVNKLPGSDLIDVWKKDTTYFKQLSEKDSNFLRKIGFQKAKTNQDLSEKQLKWLTDILVKLADAEVIKRDSKDGDKEVCDRILDAIGR